MTESHSKCYLPPSGPYPCSPRGQRCLFAVKNAPSCLTVHFHPSVICAMESLFLICSILHAKSIFLFPTDTFLEKALLLYLIAIVVGVLIKKMLN